MAEGALARIGERIGEYAMRGGGRILDSKVLMGTLIAGAVGKGLSDSVGRGTVKNAMEIAFDNPDADRMMLGTDLTPSLAVGAGVSGLAGMPARLANAERLGMYGSAISGGTALGSTVAGAGLGTLIGGGIGAKFGGLKGAIAGAIGGGAIGTAIGAGGPLAHVKGVATKNSQLLGQGPMANSSLMTANALNASGDIVLGMHNSRRR